MGNSAQLSHSGSSSYDPSHFDYQAYVQQFSQIQNNSIFREGVTLEDVINIRQAFDNLRDENDRPNEVKLSKLKQFPFFSKQDIARLPRDAEKNKHRTIVDDQINMGAYDTISKINNNNGVFQEQEFNDYSNQLKVNNNGINRGKIKWRIIVLGHVKMESKGIDCQSIMCGCNNTKTINGVQLMGIREASVTFDQFYEIMVEKVKDQQYHSNIIFESSKSIILKQQYIIEVSNVSCFLWPLFGNQ